MWEQSGDARNTVVEQYLRSRGVNLPPAGMDSLRAHPGLRHLSGKVLPAMVAAISDAVSNTIIGVHRTFLNPHTGEKAEVKPDRMILGRKRGGVIRLFRDDEIEGRLGYAEGIETALTAVAAGWPCWSAIDAGNMASLPVWPWIDLTVFADRDAAGVKTAETLARRWQASGGTANIITAQYQGEDWNDVARRREFA